MKTTIELEQKHKDIAKEKGLNLSGFVRRKLEELE